MTDVAHWLVTAGLGLFSLLLTGFAFVLWTNLRDVKNDTANLQRQNESQERELATLKATQSSHDNGFESVREALNRMDTKIDQLMMRVGYRPTPYDPGGGGGRRT